MLLAVLCTLACGAVAEGESAAAKATRGRPACGPRCAAKFGAGATGSRGPGGGWRGSPVCDCQQDAAPVGEVDDAEVVVAPARSGDPDAESGRSTGYGQCDRQCRWEYTDPLGAAHTDRFFDRRVVGARQDVPGRGCACFRDGRYLGSTEYQTTTSPVATSAGSFPHAKPFGRARDSWCAPFTTRQACAQFVADEPPETVECDAACDGGACGLDAACRAKIEAQGGVVLHCGACGACSTMHDTMVLWRTRKDITEHMTACSSAFAISNMLRARDAKRQTVGDLKQCLVAKGIDFSDDGRAWAEPAGRPTCFDCWTDNILCDKVQCAKSCWKKFFSAENAGDYNLDACLQCDENTCGPEFIKCAGSNRRSSGITSDIDRSSSKVCPIGICSGRDPCFPEGGAPADASAQVDAVGRVVRRAGAGDQ